MNIEILNLGAGKGSTAVFMLAYEGLYKFDFAIFADTGEEPKYVYDHLEFLKSLGTPRILTGTAGKLGDDLAQTINPDGTRKTGVRFASIPAFVAQDHRIRDGFSSCQEGRTRRQCTREYKSDVVERVIRRDVFGLKSGQRIPKDSRVVQSFGISVDEKHRAEKIRKRFESVPWAEPRFPLLEIGWRRGDCEDYLQRVIPEHPVRRSACGCCPYRSNLEWLELKRLDPAGFARAVEIDNALRTPGTIANRGMDKSLYLHRKCIPLEMVDLEAEAAKELRRRGPDLFNAYGCDEGMCGV